MTRLSWPLRYQLALGVALVHAVMMSVFVGDLVLRQREQLLALSLEQTASLAKTLAANSVSWVLAGDQVGLQEVVAALHNYHDLRYAVIASPEGRVLAHTDPAKVGKFLVDPVSRTVQDDGSDVHQVVADGQLVDCASPIRVQGHLIGWARTAIGRSGVTAALIRVTVNGIAYTGLAIVLGSVFAFAVANRMTRRLDQVVATSEKVHAGERALRVPESGGDELARLGRAFNAMLGAIEQSEARLRASEERFSLAVEGTRDGIWDWHPHDAGFYYSPRCRELLGIADISAPGAAPGPAGPWWELLAPEDQPVALCCLQKLETADRCAGEYRVHDAAGGVLWLSCRALARRDDSGRIIRVVGAMADITERKRAEQEIERYRDHLETLVEERTAALTETNRELGIARDRSEAANRAKSAFLANMSHEIRTPMNAILGFTQIMQRSSTLAPRDRENLEVIHRSGRNLLALINDVLEMSKIEAGRVEFSPGTVDLMSLLDDLHSMFRVPAEAKRLSWEMDKAAGLPRYEVTDESKLRQILINLVGNAVKFTETGGVVLRARTAGGNGAPDGVRRLVIEVEDTGPGITAEEQPLLFQAFRQTASGLQKGGTGLGLTISRRYARLMGGDLTVSSQPGRGSVFRLDLPVREGSPADLPAVVARRRAIGIRPGSGEVRILIADDKPDNRLFLQQLLGPIGFALREAADGFETIALWQEWQPHLILMDIVMPVMDGHEATRRIRALPGGRLVRIVALSASAFDEDREAVLATGADDFLRKPVTEDQLLSAIAGHLALEFDYSHDAGPAAAERAAAAIGPEQLARVPAELFQDMVQAAYRADDILMISLIDKLPLELAELARTLRHLVGRFDWEALDGLLEQRPAGAGI